VTSPHVALTRLPGSTGGQAHRTRLRSLASRTNAPVLLGQPIGGAGLVEETQQQGSVRRCPEKLAELVDGSDRPPLRNVPDGWVLDQG
jgi:hypothetical protein